MNFEPGAKSIRVSTDAQNDPNTARNVSWHAEFEGILNLADGKGQILKLQGTARKNEQLAVK